MYRQVLDLYATAVDYDPRSEISVEFFKIVQNKLHFAAHGNTAAEVIFKRANADAPMMGLTSFKGDHPTLRDAQIAKNYLSENELKILNNLVSGYFDFAEIQAMKRRPMYMMTMCDSSTLFFLLPARRYSTVPVRSAISRQWTKLARNTANFR